MEFFREVKTRALFTLRKWRGRNRDNGSVTLASNDRKTSRFYLAVVNEKEVIHVYNSELRITVFEINEDEFSIKDIKFDFYAGNVDFLLGFEVVNLHDFEEFHHALDWYMKYIGQPRLKLFPYDPRPASFLKKKM